MNGCSIDEEDLDAASKDIMATIDEDGDGDVTKDEFVKNALKRYIHGSICYNVFLFFSEFIKSIIN